MDERLPHRGLFDARLLAAALGESGAVAAVLDPAGAILASNAKPAAAPQDWNTFWQDHGRAQAREALHAALAGRRATVRCRWPGSDPHPGVWDCALLPSPFLGPGRVLLVARDVTAAQEASHALSKTARLHQALIEATSEIVWHYDVARNTTMRRGWFEFTGRRDDAGDFDDWLGDLHPDDRLAAKHATDEAVVGHGALTVHYRLRHASGEWRWMEDHAVPLTDADGTVTDWVGIVSDIHHQTVAREALRKSEERLRLAVEATGLGTWDWDLSTGERQWSAEARTLLGLAAGAAPTRQAFLDAIHPEDRPALAALFETGASRGGTEVFTVRLKEAGRWIEMRCRTYCAADGSPSRQVGTMQDVSERIRAEQRIWAAAHTDELTGIPNRTLFHLRLEEAIARGRREPGLDIGLAVVDLDSFKEVNDSLGHDAGDAVLKAVAARLSAAVPPGATVARLGGDEFAVILPETNEVALSAAAAALAASLEPVLSYRGRELSCCGSVGFTLLSAARGDAATALKQADLAMYAAKEAGSSRALSYQPRMSARLEHRLAVLRDARVALGRDAIMPFYQPKIALDTGAVTGFEALLRWSDGMGLRMPGDLAEALGDAQLSVLLGRRMLERVTADMAAWNREGIAFGHVGLNATAPELVGGAFAENVLSTLETAGIAPAQFEIEVTESVFLGDGAPAVALAIERLHAAGIALALDDFGTGFASLTHLRSFPVGCLKIDRSFIACLQGGTGSAAIVEAVIGLAHRLGMRVVAEGVETAEQLDFLRRNRCDAAQGFLFAKPMAASRVPGFLKTWKPFGGRLAEVRQPPAQSLARRA